MKLAWILIGTLIISLMNLTADAQEVKESNRKTDSQSRKITLDKSKLPDSLTSFYVTTLGNKIAQMQDVKASSYQLARIADLSWDHDEVYAREIFIFALGQTAVNDSDSRENIGLKAVMRRRVLSVIAKKDRVWAEKLIDSLTEETEKGGEYCYDEINLDTARSLVDVNPDAAAKFAERSLQKQISPNFITFLKELREKDRNKADGLFLQALSAYSRQPAGDVYDLAVLGTYLFTAPNLQTADSTVYAITRVGNIGVPNLSVLRPNISANLIQIYLSVAAAILIRPTSDNYQQQIKYALGYLLLPKAQQFAPGLANKISAGMSSVAATVPAEFTSGEAFSNLNPKSRPGSSERIEKNKENADENSRNANYLDIAFQAWTKGDLVNAGKAAGNIPNEKVQEQLRTLIRFKEGTTLLKKKTPDFIEAGRIADQIPNSIERGLLHLDIAATALKLKNNPAAYENLNNAAKVARNLTDARAPYLLLAVSAGLNKINPSQANLVLNEAVGKFNQSENSGETAVKWEQPVAVEPLTLNFPLAIGIDLDFENLAKENLAADDVTTPFEGLNSELLRAKAFVTLAKKLLDSEKNRSKNGVKVMLQDQTIDVGEDGMRLSARKIVMPIYPEASLKNKAKGVAVSILQYDGDGNVMEAKILESPDAAAGQAVLEAVKQWKFAGSKLQDKPINVRGKLTFYFVIDRNGKGEVKNPKQYQ